MPGMVECYTSASLAIAGKPNINEIIRKYYYYIQQSYDTSGIK